MQNGFSISEIYKENTYSKNVSNRIVQCFSLAEEGHLAFIDKTYCSVLNPFLNTTYHIPSEIFMQNTEKQGKQSKKRNKPSSDEDDGDGISCEYCLVQWTPSSIGYSGSSFLVTIKYSPEIKLWGMPYVFNSTSLTELINLTPFITSTSLYTTHCKSIQYLNCAFSKDGQFLVVSVNNLVYMFYLYWNDDQMPCLNIELKYCYSCENPITSICITDSYILYGTINGQLCQILLPVIEPTPSENANEYVLISPQKIDMEGFSIRCSSQCKEVKSNELIRLPTLLDQVHPYQSGISRIIPCDDLFLLTDFVHIVLVNSSFTPIFSVAVPEGVYAVEYTNNILYYITTTYSIVAYNPVTQTVVSSHSFLPTIGSYCDFGIIGVTPILHSQEPSFLVLSHCLKSIRTTTIDYRYQFLTVHSITLGNSSSWLPMLVYSPTKQVQLDKDWKRCSKEELQRHHIVLCNQLQCKSDKVENQDELSDALLAIQRQLLIAYHQAHESLQSKWLLFKLGVIADAEKPERDCECCKRKVIVHEGHAEWCSLGQIDQYCWFSLQPILSSHVRICPCCLHIFLEGDVCLFCNLRLIKTQCLSSEKIGRERLFWSRKTLASEWNCM